MSDDNKLRWCSCKASARDGQHMAWCAAEKPRGCDPCNYPDCGCAYSQDDNRRAGRRPVAALATTPHRKRRADAMREYAKAEFRLKQIAVRHKAAWEAFDSKALARAEKEAIIVGMVFDHPVGSPELLLAALWPKD